MLPAQKENDQRKVKAFAQRASTTRSFDRVVNSIDGLRERVQGFSAEQLSEVDQTLHAMSLRLAELQETLGAISDIKEQLDRLRPTVQRAEAENLEQNSLATLDRPIPVHYIAQVGNLLKLQRVIKLLKGAKKISGELASADSQSRQPVLPKPAEIFPEPLTKAHKAQEFAAELTAIEYTLSEGSANDSTVVTVGETSNDSETLLPPVPPRMDPEPVLETPVDGGLDLPMNELEPAADFRETEYSLAEDSGRETIRETIDVAINETSGDSETLLRATPAQLDFEPNEPFLNDSANPTFSYDMTASIHGQEITAEFPDTSDRPGRSYAIPDAGSEANIKLDVEVSSEVDFDQRLLDDLIKNYGEFNVLPNSTGVETTQENVDHNRIAMPRVESTATLNPTTQRHLPAQRKDGELDLKLKKLIKDYGEYDLYSRQSPISLKTGVAAAFLVLALAFSGFYFFSSRKSAAPSNAPTASQPEASEETASKEISTKDATRVEETLSPPSVSNAEVPRNAEAEGLRNKVAPKKTK